MHLTVSKRIPKLDHIHLVLGGEPSTIKLKAYQHHAGNKFVGWGLRDSGLKAIELAKKFDGQFLLLEDAFLRSVGNGEKSDSPVGYVLDDRGIYFDARSESRLESLIAESSLGESELKRARLIQAQIVRKKVSKYNLAFDRLPEGFCGEYVLVVDQRKGDVSVLGGMADESCFIRMLETAVKENPDKTILVKGHPDAALGYQGYLVGKDQDRIKFVKHSLCPHELISGADSVYVVSSQLGFEALLHNKKVHCFGWPWYAGWGLTQDRLPMHKAVEGRRRHRSLENLIIEAYCTYSSYIDPVSGNAWDVFDAIEYLFANRRAIQRVSGKRAYNNINFFKKRRLRKFFPEQKLASGRQVEWTWGPDKGTGSRKVLDKLFVEDGFVRSIGLGTQRAEAFSYCLDRQGVYFDARGRTDLQELLEECSLDVEEKKRASNLLTFLKEKRFSKYNLQESKLEPSLLDSGFRLVVGQVPLDASIEFGCKDIRSNLDLIKQVKADFPDDVIAYKTHPDLLAQKREPDPNQSEILELANVDLSGRSIADCVQHAFSVHTMTSLTGLEALIQGKEVYCYGLPFYSGYGLTSDKFRANRSRSLTLDELVYLCFVRYPCYKVPGQRYYGTLAQVLYFLEERLAKI